MNLGWIEVLKEFKLWSPFAMILLDMEPRNQNPRSRADGLQWARVTLKSSLG